MNIVETFLNLLEQTAFFSLSYGNYLMICVALIFLYLGIAKGFEPLLMVPIAFGMLLVNIYPDIMLSPEKSINGTGGLLWYFFRLDEWTIFPSLIFLGVGAQTDFSPLIANPISFLLGAAAQFGIYAAYFFAIFMGFNGAAAAAISIIGGADGPTSIFLCNKLGQTALLGPIAVAAYYACFNNERRKNVQDGTASPGFQAGKDSLPYRCNRCGLSFTADYGSSCGNADARKPF